MPLAENFILMAEYNFSMNQKIYNACAQFPDGDIAIDRGAFFGSILNTLNHIMVGDIIWLKRFADHGVSYSSLDYVRQLSNPSALGEVLYNDFSVLRKKREEMDAVILLFSKELTDADLSQPISYTNTKGISLCMLLGYVVQHFFNHQTHHRGQVTTLLSQQGVDIGMTDLLMNIPTVTD